jgi:hypothetical protein
LNQAEHAGLDELDQPSNIWALLAKWRYSAASDTASFARQRRGGDLLALGLFQHRRQGLEDLQCGAGPAWCLPCDVADAPCSGMTFGDDSGRSAQMMQVPAAEQILL